VDDPRGGGHEPVELRLHGKIVSESVSEDVGGLLTGASARTRIAERVKPDPVD
jgi:hypothetical protein